MNQSQLNFQKSSNNSFLNSSNISSSFPNIGMYNNIKTFKTKKRNYNEFLESYRQYHNTAFLSEAESLHKTFNLKFRKNFQNMDFNFKGENIIKNQKKMISNDFPQISHQKKIMNLDSKKKFINEEDDDIELIEKDFNISDKKYGLSKSYLFDEDSKFYSDLDDTKENSFYSLNFSFDYPEINLDSNIKDKLISNAIELEKTFNRIFNVKNMPNKNNGIVLYSKMKEYKEKFIWNKFIEKLKKDSTDKIDKEISEMIIDSSDEDNDGAMPKYNSLYNDNFFDDNDMILDG